MPNGRSRGFGTVLLSSQEETNNAIHAFNGFEWHGRKLEVREDRGSPQSFSKPQESSLSGRALYVGNLPFSVGWMDLKDFFRQVGNVQRADVPMDYQGRSRGFGTVVMSSAEDAQKAIAQLNGHEWNGRRIEVREDRNPSEGGSHQQHNSHHQNTTSSSGGHHNDYHRSPPPMGPNVAGRALYVGNLPFTIQWQELKDLARQAGTVQRADIITDAQGRSRGYGQVLMATVEEAQKCIELLNGTEVEGRTIEVREDKYAGDSSSVTPGTQVYVGNLPYSTRWMDLKDLFRPFGLNPIHADVITEPNGRSKGFGIVRFSTKEECERAVAEVNGQTVANRNII
ncbi:hypothetical protein HK098_006995, partial [Nowakowskiella sp. JEL0407]